MPESALAKKMRLKAGARAAVIGAPGGYLNALAPLPARVEVSETLDGRFDWIQVFVRTRAELARLAPGCVEALAEDGLLWVSFPKGTSGIQTDLTRDEGWDALADAGLKWVMLISVDSTWSAFSLRRHRPGEPTERARR
ncbi:MAG TPA: hypothetical protein VMT19_08100 [Thermoanaerobaculaceae bacterium]|nr:hypothetical protein [Thermoanaerobaculaceae bacterium]